MMLWKSERSSTLNELNCSVYPEYQSGSQGHLAVMSLPSTWRQVINTVRCIPRLSRGTPIGPAEHHHNFESKKQASSHPRLILKLFLHHMPLRHLTMVAALHFVTSGIQMKRMITLEERPPLCLWIVFKLCRIDGIAAIVFFVLAPRRGCRCPCRRRLACSRCAC